MTFEEAKTAISQIYGHADNMTAKEKETVSAIHAKVFAEPVKQCNCKNVYSDALVRLMIWFRKNSTFRTCKYYMQAGEAFMLGPICYNNYNLTDEVAEKLIATNPKAAKMIHLYEPAEEKPAEVKETATNEVKETAPIKKATTKKAKK